jgi:signal transduction histidine kinase
MFDHRGRLWVATSNRGLFRFDQPMEPALRFRQYGYSDGLSSHMLRGLAEDRNGGIYVATLDGVARLDPDLSHVRHFSSADGMAPGNVFAAYRDRTGVMWFATKHGLTRLEPQNNHASDPPPVWITGVSIAGRRAPVSEAGESSIRRVEVRPGQEHIQFDFVGLRYSPGDVLRYQYHLGDDAWSTPIAERAVHYASLAPGHYRFAVRAVNSDGQASLAPATVDFQVAPRLWRRAWFQGILLAMAIGGALLLHRARVAKLLEIERIRMHIATDLHDDIGSSLSQIAVLSEVARQRSAGGKADELVDRIGALSRELLDSIGDIVWAIQPHKDHLSDLKQRMRRFAADVLSLRNVEMHWPASGSGHDPQLNSELRRQVYLIFKESINNIARHSHATKAHIDLEVVKGQLALEVSDNGCGIESQNGHNGNGLESMKLRAAQLGGELEVRSAKGHGTTVILRVPRPV